MPKKTISKSSTATIFINRNKKKQVSKDIGKMKITKMHGKLGNISKSKKTALPNFSLNNSIKDNKIIKKSKR